MKLLDIIKELEKPKQIYADRDPNKQLTIADLTPEERDELFAKGSLLVKMAADPNRPETSVSQVINLPKMDQVKKDIIQNKKEFDVFMFSPDPDIKAIAKEINKNFNQLYRAMNALDKSIDLKRRGRV
jgi:hypothetical protein